jgi:hypothetical protein
METAPNDSMIPTRHAEALEAEVDGERVLMSPKNFAYFGLMDTGALVWDRIDGSTSIGEMIAALVSEFDADETTVRSDVTEFISALDAAGLLAES